MSKFLSFQVIPPSFVYRINLFVPTKKPFLSSTKSTSNGFASVSRSTSDQGLDDPMEALLTVQPLRATPTIKTRVKLMTFENRRFISKNKERENRQLLKPGFQK